MQDRKQRFALIALLLAVGLGSPAIALGGDWPQLGYDAGHRNYAPDPLARTLHLQWSRQEHPPHPAWPPSQWHLRFDAVAQPVAAGKMLFVPSSVTDSVTAYDTETGKLRWRFYADGPVRLAPVADGSPSTGSGQGKVYFASDDGHLYCVSAADGKLVWRFAAMPTDRKVVGNDRVISTWPIRGGPVLLNGRIYITAGIWPFMGIFAHCVDAKSGQAIWSNTGEGSKFREQPHKGASAFAGFVPRGQLAATEHGVVAPGGRTLPGCYDPKTGLFRYFAFGTMYTGGSHVSAMRKSFFLGGTRYNMANGQKVGGAGGSIHTDKASYGRHWRRGTFSASPRGAAAPKKAKPGDGPQELSPHGPWSLAPPEGTPKGPFIKAGDRFYVGGKNKVAAMTLNVKDKRIEMAWQHDVAGTVGTLLAADGKLFAVTNEGTIYCFGAGKAAPKTYGDIARHLPETRALSLAAAAKTRAEAIVKAAGSPGGYGVVLGLGDDGLAEALVGASTLRLVVIDSDAKAIAAFRERMDAAGLYGTRVTGHVGDPATYRLPQYVASLAVCRDAAPSVRILRPYGGAACLLPGVEAELPGTEAKPLPGGGTLRVRTGPPKGAADWTHQYADAGNTLCSQDDRVRLPLGLLWFGGPSNDQVLPRHGHGPAPQVAAGRLFIEGLSMLRAIDIYTGRLLWQRKFPHIGKFYGNTSHHPGANMIGSNYTSTPDSVYLVDKDKILQLAAATGKTMSEFRQPESTDDKIRYWGYLSVWKDLLAATSGPVKYTASSKELVIMDRKTGKVLWRRRARYGFRHNAIAMGSGKLFCIDGVSPKRRGSLPRAPKDADEATKKKFAYAPRLLALDVRTGKELWAATEKIYGTFVSYSAEHDVVLKAGAAARDRPSDEIGAGMRAYRGADGTLLWESPARYSGPCIINGDTIITQIAAVHKNSGPAWSLLTGKPRLRKHPLTGREWHWRYWRFYGCNTASAGKHLLLFRSGAAGYADWTGDSGTGNFGGFKSGCTSNMIPAGGVLAIPEYTRTCGCHYQNQTSLGLVHDPQVDMWTFNCAGWDGSPIRRIGINLGAHGDRRSAGGTLWLEFPFWGGPTPMKAVALKPASLPVFRLHSRYVKAAHDGVLTWVASSGVTGIQGLTVKVSGAEEPKQRTYTVRLHFVEVYGYTPGGRVFDVALQGKTVLKGLDVVKEAGGAARGIVKEFKGVKVAGTLTVSFDSAAGSPGATLSGVEIIADGW